MEEGKDDWDIDEVRGDHESDEHWELRRNFLSANKERFSRLRLLSLSQVFVNVEFLGCRYPEETMDLVKEMSVGIVEEYRKARSTRLQRTFVKASDAAEKKSKGATKRHSSTPSENQPKIFIPAKDNSPKSSYHLDPMESSLIYEKEVEKHGLDLKSLVLLEQEFLDNEGAFQLINRSCGMSHVPFALEFDVQQEAGAGFVHVCKLKIGMSLVVEGKGFSKETARSEAGKNALEILRRLCYTIQVKESVLEFGKTEIAGGVMSQNQETIGDNNVGNKMLRLMGWDGLAGLGKNGTGIQAPVSTEGAELIQRSRLGLGLSSKTAELGESVKCFLQTQMSQIDQFDLQFSSDFNSDERKIIHQVASQLGLKSKSRGKGDHRFLVVSKKVKLSQLVAELLRSGENLKYRVILPTLLQPPSSPNS